MLIWWSSFARFDPDLMDKYGNALIENEFHVNKNILRPTRKTRDQIEILSNFMFREPARRYTGKFMAWDILASAALTTVDHVCLSIYFSVHH